MALDIASGHRLRRPGRVRGPSLLPLPTFESRLNCYRLAYRKRTNDAFFSELLQVSLFAGEASKGSGVGSIRRMVRPSLRVPLFPLASMLGWVASFSSGSLPERAGQKIV